MLACRKRGEVKVADEGGNFRLTKCLDVGEGGRGVVSEGWDVEPQTETVAEPALTAARAVHSLLASCL